MMAQPDCTCRFEWKQASGGGWWHVWSRDWRCPIHGYDLKVVFNPVANAKTAVKKFKNEGWTIE